MKDFNEKVCIANYETGEVLRVNVIKQADNLAVSDYLKYDNKGYPTTAWGYTSKRMYKLYEQWRKNPAYPKPVFTAKVTVIQDGKEVEQTIIINMTLNNVYASYNRAARRQDKNKPRRFNNRAGSPRKAKLVKCNFEAVTETTENDGLLNVDVIKPAKTEMRLARK